MIRNRIEYEVQPIVSRFSPTSAGQEVMVTEEVLADGTINEIDRKRIKWCCTMEELIGEKNGRS